MTSTGRLLLAMAWLALSMSASAATATLSGKIARDEAVRAEPKARADAVVELKKGDPVTILKRQGGWYQVRVETTTLAVKALEGTAAASNAPIEGWLRIYWVRTQSRRPNSARPLSGIGDAARLATDRRTGTDVVATLGVRGLDEEQLKAAHFDAAQMTTLEANAVKESDAKSFAAAIPLRTQFVNELQAGGKP